MEVSDFLMILVMFMFLLFICFIVGMFNPLIVIRWGRTESRNRKKVFIFFGLSSLFLFVSIRLFSIHYYMYNNGSIKNSNDYQIKSSNAIKETISITPKEIYDDFDNNKIRANTKYKDKNISITGKIYVITEDGGTPSIGLVDSDNKYKVTIPEVYCSFVDNKQNDKIAKLSKGLMVTIEGTLDTGGSSVYIKNCTLK